jgi:hypothetical protein
MDCRFHPVFGIFYGFFDQGRLLVGGKWNSQGIE